MRDSGGIERRRCIRYQLNCPLRHRLAGESSWKYAYTDNIGEGGVLFISFDAYPEGGEVELLLSFPGVETPLIPIKGNVVWHLTVKTDEKLTFLVGVEFSFMDYDQSEYINFLIRKCQQTMNN